MTAAPGTGLAFGAPHVVSASFRIGHFYASTPPDRICKAVLASLRSIGVTPDPLNPFPASNGSNGSRRFSSLCVNVRDVPADLMHKVKWTLSGLPFEGLPGRWTNLTCTHWYPGGAGIVGIAPEWLEKNAGKYIGASGDPLLKPVDDKPRDQASLHKLQRALRTQLYEWRDQRGIPVMLLPETVMVADRHNAKAGDAGAARVAFSSKPMARAAVELCPDAFFALDTSSRTATVPTNHRHTQLLETFLYAQFEATPDPGKTVFDAPNFVFRSVERRKGAHQAAKALMPDGSAGILVDLASNHLDWDRTIVVSRHYPDRPVNRPGINRPTKNAFENRVKALRLPVEAHVWQFRATEELPDGGVAALVYEVLAPATREFALKALQGIASEFDHLPSNPYNQLLARAYRAPQSPRVRDFQREPTPENGDGDGDGDNTNNNRGRGRGRGTPEGRGRGRGRDHASPLPSAPPASDDRKLGEKKSRATRADRSVVFTKERVPKTVRDSTVKEAHLSPKQIRDIIAYVNNVSVVAAHSQVPRVRPDQPPKAPSGLVIEFETVEARDMFYHEHQSRHEPKRDLVDRKKFTKRTTVDIGDTAFSIGRFNSTYKDEMRVRHEESKQLHAAAAAAVKKASTSLVERTRAVKKPRASTNASQKQQQREKAKKAWKEKERARKRGAGSGAGAAADDTPMAANHADQPAARAVAQPPATTAFDDAACMRLPNLAGRNWTAAGPETEYATFRPYQITAANVPHITKYTAARLIQTLAHHPTAPCMFAYPIWNGRDSVVGIQVFWPDSVSRQQSAEVLGKLKAPAGSTLMRNNRWLSCIDRMAKLTLVRTDTSLDDKAVAEALRQAIDPRLHPVQPLYVDRNKKAAPVLEYASAAMAQVAWVHLNAFAGTPAKPRAYGPKRVPAVFWPTESPPGS